MKDILPEHKHKIIVIDDNKEVCDAFSSILIEGDQMAVAEEEAKDFFGIRESGHDQDMVYDLEFSRHGEDGVQKVRDAFSTDRPFELAFVDMRMPPGWDGLKTIKNIWKVDPDIPVVLCTAYSNYSWTNICKKIRKSDNMLILKKPFDPDEVKQLARMLTDKYTLSLAAKRHARERDALLKDLATKNEELEMILYTTSHDLRSPLVNIQGFSGEIALYYEEIRKILQHAEMPESKKEHVTLLLDTEMPEALDFIKKSVQKMDQILMGLLHLSRLGRMSLDFSNVDMNRIVADAVHALQLEIDERGIEVTVEKLPGCRCDPSQIYRVFYNLIENAVKFSDKNRLGKICISGQLKSENLMEFCVEDNGKGISAKNHDKIFQVFFQENAGEQSSGKGLGLSAIHRILDRNNGDVRLESEPGRGSRFYVILPEK